MKISHLSLGVSDIAESEVFYRDVLGLSTQRDGDEVRVQWPDFLLMLIEKPPTDRSKFHFGFQVGSGAEVDTLGGALAFQQRANTFRAGR